MPRASDAHERERLETDLLFVGAGPATLACAIRIADLCKLRGVEPPSMLVIEKAAEVGAHQLSGASSIRLRSASCYPTSQSRAFPWSTESTASTSTS